jgi:transposase-like protein
METGKSLTAKAKGMRNVPELYAKYPDEKACLDLLMEVLYDDKPQCPDCSSTEHYFIKTRKKYKCKKCKRQFAITSGTIFESKKAPLRKWLAALLLVCSHPKGISSIQLSKEIDVTQKTAWVMLTKFRKIFKQTGALMQGEIQADELYVGGKQRNKSILKKQKEREYAKKEKAGGVQGRSMRYKYPVLGLYERLNNRFICIPLRSTSELTIYNEFTKHVQPWSTTIFTDQSKIYNKLYPQYDRQTINHSIRVFKDGRVTTNRIECFWGLARRCIVGTYHHISFKHAEGYFAELGFKQQHINLTIGEKFILALTYSRKRITRNKIMAFNMYMHNHSGRGPDYPLKFLKETRKRGLLPKARKEQLQAESKYFYSKDMMWKNKETFEHMYEGYVEKKGRRIPKKKNEKLKVANWNSNWTISASSSFDSGFKYSYVP